MRKLTCQECGRSYDYDKDDLCPKCGCFNSPRGGAGTKLERDLLSRFESAPRYIPKSSGAAQEGAHRRHGDRIESCRSNPTRIAPGQTRPNSVRPAARDTEKKKKSPLTVVLIVVAAAFLLELLPMLFFRLRWLLDLY